MTTEGFDPARAVVLDAVEAICVGAALRAVLQEREAIALLDDENTLPVLDRVNERIDEVREALRQLDDGGEGGDGND